MTNSIKLPKNLNSDMATALKAQFEDLLGQPVTISAENVQFLGGLCFQVVLAARKQWQEDGVELTLGPYSPEFETSMARLGVPVDTFSGDI